MRGNASEEVCAAPISPRRVYKFSTISTTIRKHVLLYLSAAKDWRARYDDKRLTPEERESFIALMARLKEDNPWLPAVKDATLPRALQYDEDAGVVEEYASSHSGLCKVTL